MDKDNLKKRIIRVAITSVIVFSIANVVASFGVSGNDNNENDAVMSQSFVLDVKDKNADNNAAKPSVITMGNLAQSPTQRPTESWESVAKKREEPTAAVTATVNPSAKATKKAAATLKATEKATEKVAKAVTAKPTKEATTKPAKEAGAQPTKAAKKQEEDASKTQAVSTDKASEKPKKDKKDDYSDVIVAKSDKVNDNYFDDALFIGDSRVEGFKLSSGLSTGFFATKTGASITDLSRDEIIRYHGRSYTIYEYLRENKFAKIYIKTGINELGWAYPEVFIDKYREFIENIKDLQPDAVIYVESIIHVTKSLNDSSDVFKNSKIDKQNERIMKMVRETGVNYIDLNEIFTDSDGALAEDAANDGVHMNTSYLKRWLDYLKCHVVA